MSLYPVYLGKYCVKKHDSSFVNLVIQVYNGDKIYEFGVISLNRNNKSIEEVYIHKSYILYSTDNILLGNIDSTKTLKDLMCYSKSFTNKKNICVNSSETFCEYLCDFLGFDFAWAFDFLRDD